ncbi:DUF943 family protein [Winslowiella iniecta]|uniref:Uncharacterized protein n=1 Tax=Winslowiella iniecta TaxID=1560201 RepID=A0A0L7SYL2_9GAMM|nr:DUF943 family protein [Winslowiella iniecta]KOC88046.1 hypothetical protein NG42_17615 [Winslowiella iniecta]KOC88142.1 hypothetical protein NG43_20715 [Winslowiella iniecta]
MKSNYLKIALILLLLPLIYFIWLLAQPVQIIAVHTNSHWTEVLVKNFPLTSRGKVDWWESNKTRLKEKYGMPETDNDGRYSITFWDFGNGYEIEQPDKSTFFPSKDTDHLFCFEDMKVKARCIRKENILMNINTTSENLIRFDANGDVYYQDKNGKISEGERFSYTVK